MEMSRDRDMRNLRGELVRAALLQLAVAGILALRGCSLRLPTNFIITGSAATFQSSPACTSTALPSAPVQKVHPALLFLGTTIRPPERLSNKHRFRGMNPIWPGTNRSGPRQLRARTCSKHHIRDVCLCAWASVLSRRLVGVFLTRRGANEPRGAVDVGTMLHWIVAVVFLLPVIDTNPSPT